MNAKIKLIRLLYAKASGYYPSALVGLELVDQDSQVVLQTKCMQDTPQGNKEFILKEFEL